MFVAYNNPRYDLNGNWSSQTERLHLWFPIVDASPSQIQDFNDHRHQKLMFQLSGPVVKPSVELVISDDIPQPDADHNFGPPVSASELAVEQSASGLVVVSGKYSTKAPQSAPRSVLERCGLMIEDCYADQMLERIES